MQPTENQDATYLPSNSVDLSLIWLIVGAVGMGFLLFSLIGREPSTKKNDASYLSRRANEEFGDERRDDASNSPAPDIGIR